MKEYPPSYLARLAILCTSMIVGSVVLIFCLPGIGEDEKSMIGFLVGIVLGFTMLIRAGIVCSRTKKQKHMTSEEVRSYFVNNSFFAAVFAIFAICTLIRGCMYWQESKELKSQNANQIKPAEPVAPTLEHK